MAFEQIIYSVADGIATITLNRPEKLNAFTGKMMSEMIEAFDMTDADDNVKAVIVTGSGRAFCAGADLSEGAKTFDYDALGVGRGGGNSPTRADGTTDYSHHAVRDGGGRLTLCIFESLKPVIGAINGAAVGIGVTMQLAIDIRIASDAARFGFVFARRGIVPEAASSWFLPRIVGIQQALEWVYTGDILTAEQALAGKLVRSVHAPDELLPAAYELARKFSQNKSPVAVAFARQMLYRNAAQPHPIEAHRIDTLAMFYTSLEDGKEGVSSFLEKRDPAYTGKASAMPAFYPWWKQA